MNWAEMIKQIPTFKKAHKPNKLHPCPKCGKMTRTRLCGVCLKENEEKILGEPFTL